MYYAQHGQDGSILEFPTRNARDRHCSIRMWWEPITKERAKRIAKRSKQNRTMAAEQRIIADARMHIL